MRKKHASLPRERNEKFYCVEHYGWSGSAGFIDAWLARHPEGHCSALPGRHWQTWTSLPLPSCLFPPTSPPFTLLRQTQKMATLQGGSPKNFSFHFRSSKSVTSIVCTDFSAISHHLIFCLHQQAVKLCRDPDSSFAKGIHALILCQHGMKPTQQIHTALQASNNSGSTALWSMLYYGTSVRASRNCAYDLGAPASR